MSLLNHLTYLIVSAGIFAGAVTSGLMGFAFPAVAGAILLHVLPARDQRHYSARRLTAP